MPLDKYRAANLENWNDRVPIHWESDGYNIRQFIDDPEHISDVVQFDLDHEEIGDVAGKSLLHLQCHIGHDTRSWGRLGANVTGVGFAGGAQLAGTGRRREGRKRSGRPTWWGVYSGRRSDISA